MSQVEVSEEIEHLDFEPEKEEEFRHFPHPTDPLISWCNKHVFEDGHHFSQHEGAEGGKATKVNCVACLHLYIQLGVRWWWITHNTFYGSSCYASPVHHDCGA